MPVRTKVHMTCVPIGGGYRMDLDRTAIYNWAYRPSTPTSEAGTGSTLCYTRHLVVVVWEETIHAIKLDGVVIDPATYVPMDQVAAVVRHYLPEQFRHLWPDFKK